MTNTGDKRRALRISVDLPARYRSGSRSLDGRALNLSQTGMLFLTAENGESSGDVQIELHLPDEGTPLLLPGEVRWCLKSGDTQGIGICFAHLPVIERRRIANFVILCACDRQS